MCHVLSHPPHALPAHAIQAGTRLVPHSPSSKEGPSTSLFLPEVLRCGTQAYDAETQPNNKPWRGPSSLPSPLSSLPRPPPLAARTTKPRPPPPFPPPGHPPLSCSAPRASPASFALTWKGTAWCAPRTTLYAVGACRYVCRRRGWWGVASNVSFLRWATRGHRKLPASFGLLLFFTQFVPRVSYLRRQGNQKNIPLCAGKEKNSLSSHASISLPPPRVVTYKTTTTPP